MKKRNLNSYNLDVNSRKFRKILASFSINKDDIDKNILIELCKGKLGEFIAPVTMEKTTTRVSKEIEIENSFYGKIDEFFCYLGESLKYELNKLNVNPNSAIISEMYTLNNSIDEQNKENIFISLDCLELEPDVIFEKRVSLQQQRNKLILIYPEIMKKAQALEDEKNEETEKNKLRIQQIELEIKKLENEKCNLKHSKI